MPGFEASGRVVAVGEGVERDRVGEHVIALTGSDGFAEVVVAPSVPAIAAPGVDARTAAAFGRVTSTAYDLINTVAGVRPGQNVLVHAAAGGVGTLAVRFARAAGAGRVVGVVGDPGQVGYARQAGYDQVLGREEFPHALGGERVDVILDPSAARPGRPTWNAWRRTAGSRSTATSPPPSRSPPRSTTCRRRGRRC